ncbi:hypothetical protein GCM10020001_097370 [Nonomuraea salmonea]
MPADQICLAGEDCENYSPTFFTRKRLAKVTTQVLDGGAYKDVDSWTLTHTFPKPGDGMSAALWLAKIQHTGHVGGTQSMPAVDFDGVEMPNRVDGREGIAPMMKWRVLSVNNESGGRLTVNYSKPECARGATPQPHANTKRCFPTHWAPEGASDPYLDWFHKYVAVQVLESDLTGGSVTVRSDYAYPPDGAAWAYDDQELVPAERRTWSQWRGYERVQVTRGEEPDRRIATEHLFFRGLHGDKQPTGTRTAYVTDSQGTRVQDHWRLQGFERETRYLLGPGGQEQSGTINDPWLSGPTAEGGGDEAYLLDTAKVRSRAKLSTGGLRLMETRRSYDSTGAVTQVEDLGDTGTAADDRCTRYTYARNTSAWILHLPSRIETVAVTCSQTPRRPDDVVGDARMSYDGGAYGAAPAKGDQTQVEELDHYADGQPVYVPVSRTAYDQYGRLTESVDATGRKTGTAYTPATGGPVTSVATTNPLGHVTTTWLKPEWGAMTAEEDPNGRRTELAYDPLGRLAKVWLPGRASSQSPSGEFSYQVRTDGPVVVTTRTLRPDGGHTVGHELYDGLMRLRQTQLPGHGGDWLLGDTVYNTLGQVAKKNDLYASTGPPATAILGVADSAVPAQTVYEYDAMGRQSAEALMVLGQEKWRTTTTHFPDRVDMDPPAGATPMTSLLDAQGRTVELRQYKGQSPTGDHDATRYTYDRNGLEASVTDAQGSVWRTHYDLRNRVTKLEDPDRGTTTFGYDVLGRTTSTTDARGRTLAFVYDRLDRQVATHEGSSSGAKLTEWTYDTLPDGTSVKGMPVSSVRHSGGQSYVTRVDAYDERYRPTSITQVIPSSEGGLAGSYTVEPRYNDDGTVRSVKYPAAGDLPEETVRTTYTALGLPVQTRSSLATYVNDTLYSRHGEQLQVRWGAEGSQVLHDYTYEVGTRRLLRHIVDRETAGQVRQADVRYSYDPAGNITGIADTPPVANAASDVQCFTYDYLRRLTGAWSATDGCAAPPGLAVVGGPAPYWHSYTYDRSGNRLTETRHAAGGGHHQHLHLSRGHTAAAARAAAGDHHRPGRRPAGQLRVRRLREHHPAQAGFGRAAAGVGHRGQPGQGRRGGRHHVVPLRRRRQPADPARPGRHDALSGGDGGAAGEERHVAHGDPVLRARRRAGRGADRTRAHLGGGGPQRHGPARHRRRDLGGHPAALRPVRQPPRHRADFVAIGTRLHRRHLRPDRAHPHRGTRVRRLDRPVRLRRPAAGAGRPAEPERLRLQRQQPRHLHRPFGPCRPVRPQSGGLPGRSTRRWPGRRLGQWLRRVHATSSAATRRSQPEGPGRGQEDDQQVLDRRRDRGGRRDHQGSHRLHRCPRLPAGQPRLLRHGHRGSGARRQDRQGPEGRLQGGARRPALAGAAEVGAPGPRGGGGGRGGTREVPGRSGQVEEGPGGVEGDQAATGGRRGG